MRRFIPAWTLAVLALLSICAAAQAAPSAVIQKVRLMPRADLSAAAWSKSDDTYHRSYVYPIAWRVLLSGCGSEEDASANVPSVPRLSWRLEPLDGQPGATPFTVVAGPAECKIIRTVPAMGRWRVTLTAADTAGVTATATKELTFRDLVVAAVGDSFASGEGNKVKAAGDVKGWIDPQCHRSYNAWPAFLARALENDGTAVTYVSFACSGSDLSNLINKRYSGIKSGAALAPQILALRELIGDPTLPECPASVSASLPPCGRPVHALLGATGLNTIDVSHSLIRCVIDSLDELLLGLPRLIDLDIEGAVAGIPLGECQRDFSGQLNRLPKLLDGLELAMSANLRVAQVHLIGYPARIMTDLSDDYPKKLTGFWCSISTSCVTNATLCGVFANTKVSDKQWMTKTVDAINGALRDAGKRNGWTVTQTRDLFRRRGYCTPDGVTWFRSFNASLRLQHDVNGTAHPTRDGHVAAFEAVRPRIRRDAVAPPPDRFVVDIRKLAVTLADHDAGNRERPRQVGSTKLSIFGATRATCGPPVVAPTPAASRGPAARSAATCQSFAVATAGKTINIRASADIQRFIPRNPPDPKEPGAGHGKTITLDVQRLHLRANNWNATVLLPGPSAFEVPVQRLVAESSGFGKLELEYTITKPFTNNP